MHRAGCSIPVTWFVTKADSDCDVLNKLHDQNHGASGAVRALHAPGCGQQLQCGRPHARGASRGSRRARSMLLCRHRPSLRNPPTSPVLPCHARSELADHTVTHPMMYNKFGDPTPEIAGAKSYLVDQCGIPAR